MNQSHRITAFTNLGKELDAVLHGTPATEAGQRLQDNLPTAHLANGWYTEANVRHRLTGLVESLTSEVLERWLSAYDFPEREPKNIGVILAGNIPLVGFDDFRCVLLSGNRFLGKLPSDDKRLLPLVAEILCSIEPKFQPLIVFADGRMQNMDAVIATGSNNSARYFEHYFSKYPHIIRKNRNSVAVLDGSETKEELDALGEDIFRYFGLGCRSVTKLFLPENYNKDKFYEAMFRWSDELMASSKYMNNYEYHKTIYLLHSVKLLDNNFLLLKEDEGIASPPGIVFWESYESLTELRKKLRGDRELIQCVVSREKIVGDAVPFGKSQQTMPWDYADGVDVMKFLASL
jgi:hypothetical protein